MSNDQYYQTVVWVVEDDEHLRGLLALQLNRKRIQCELFSNGQACLDYLDASPLPNLILLDVMMPGLTGFEVLKKIREKFDQTRVPVILLTAVSASEDIVRGLELGANDYVTKPYQFEEIYARVQVQLKLQETLNQQQQQLSTYAEFDRLKDEAILTVSHDLKDPIGVIKTGIRLLETGVTPTEGDLALYTQVIDAMNEATGLMQPMVDEFLNLQAIKNQRLRLQPEQALINDLLNGVLTQYAQHAGMKGIELNCNGDGRRITAMVDPLRLRQAIGNLVSNAIKNTPESGAVTVHLHANTTTIRIEVEDTGPGIAEEDIPKLFEAFSELSDQRRDKFSTGVGLYIARKLVELHGGVLDVTSTIGEGSTFWFEIPCHNGEMQVEEFDHSENGAA